ncbi:MAG TPA: MBL fold metallo-hydrolase [Candidatus Polarisedimenticolia bacterium]|nr:MBL fold metallo-hydrolase [Candidatus Polarisedimenticolia bacterium]
MAGRLPEISGLLGRGVTGSMETNEGVVMGGTDLYLKQMEIGPMANFVYLIGPAGSKETAVVDPAWDVGAILRAAEADDRRIVAALVTHWHPDHTNGVEDLVERTDARVYVNREEVPWLQHPARNLKEVGPGEELRLGDLTLQFLHTPGHTPGSQCFLVRERLVSGDTLFINACGRTDLPGGDPERLYKSLSGTLRRLDDRTILLPGHNYADVSSTTLGEQKTNNPFLCCASLNSFLRLVGGPLGI